ncbi:MAG: AAA family ATPase [Candidatus Omnitrophica bacterium]|nr:AAA family ATPase [Candidatus Omnitrophota bacterium]
MRLEKLEITGFKSFPERTILKFEPGITAIVGPNGSGKSNIFDAIRWVLGEQSAKEMRGSKMEDVIFNGTDTKEPLSMAEVSLTLSNEDKKLAIESKEVVISRRIFRSGENEYLINHNPVRLKDINDLLRGTGVGLDSYSLFGQGKIELILSSKPEDRRIIFDEASGILKYKLQKKEAVKKLEETENNLLRINDIIAEVRRQINSLEKQANKAKRYREIWEKIKEKEKLLSILKINKLVKEKEEILNKINEYTKQEKDLKDSYQRQLIQSESYQREIELIEEEIFKIKEEIIHIEHLIDRNQQSRMMIKERIEDLRKHKENIDVDRKNMQYKLKQLQIEIENFNQNYKKLKELLIEKKSILDEKESYLDKINQMKQEAKDNIEKAKKDILELNNLKSKIKNELIDLDTQYKLKEARERRLNIEKTKSQQEKDDLQNKLEKEKEKLNNLETSFNIKRQEIESLQDNLQKEIKDIDNLKSELQELEKEKTKFISRKDFLENLNLNYEKMDSASNALILLESLSEEEPNGLVIRIKEKLNCNDADKNIFAQANFKFLGEAKSIDFDLERLLVKIKQTEEYILQKNKLINDKTNNTIVLQNNIDIIHKEIYQLELSISEQKNQLNHIESQFKKIDEEFQIVIFELSEVIKEIDTLNEKKSNLTQQYNELENRIKTLEENLHKETERVIHLDLEREGYLLEIAAIKVEQKSLEDNLQKEDHTLALMKQNLVEIENRLNEYQKQTSECDKKIGELNSNLNNLDISDDELTKEKVSKTQKVEAEHLKLQGYIKQLSDFKAEIEKLRIDIEEVNSNINNFRMELQHVIFKISNIKDRLKQIYQIELTEDTTVLPLEYNEKSLQLEIDTLKQQLDSLGSVNLVAIEEHDELKKRYEFLNQQQQDLIQAKTSLYEAIQKINRTAKNMFLDTFKSINNEFKVYFRLLFGGGEANLFLIEEDDPLESGIEIIARPPGKKLQNISLLSGGEKALCTIALIFAIFKVKPSPFCVLDEVDAALDEANISRYANILDEFSKIAQFIVITHNKRTLLNADAMYGVTMEANGISRVVSIKFEKNKEKDRNSEEVVVLT